MNFTALQRTVETTESIRVRGKVSQMLGLVIESNGPPVSIGELCQISLAPGVPAVNAEVVGFKQNKVLLMPLGPMEGIAPGSRVVKSLEISSRELQRTFSNDL